MGPQLATMRPSFSPGREEAPLTVQSPEAAPAVAFVIKVARCLATAGAARAEST